MYKIVLEYNSGLQDYNKKLQNELNSAHENVRNTEKEKATIMENLSTLRGQHKSLQDQYALCKVSFFISMSVLSLLFDFDPASVTLRTFCNKEFFLMSSDLDLHSILYLMKYSAYLLFSSSWNVNIMIFH